MEDEVDVNIFKDGHPFIMQATAGKKARPPELGRRRKLGRGQARMLQDALHQCNGLVQGVPLLLGFEGNLVVLDLLLKPDGSKKKMKRFRE